MPAIATLACTAIDCADPRALAAFYAQITGWPLDEDHCDADWVQLRSDSGPTLAFQQVDGYQPPRWPSQDHPQQAHLDFAVPDLDAAEARLLEVGARRHDLQPGTDFRVYLDPEDHPFCLVLHQP